MRQDELSMTQAAGGRDTAAEQAIPADAVRVQPGPGGSVILPEGVELSDIVVMGRDLVVTLPDGSVIVIEGGAVFVPTLVIDGVEVPSQTLAALLIGDEEPRPAAGDTPSSGGNFAVAVGDLGPRAPLGDLLPPTELDYTPPTFDLIGLSLRENSIPDIVVDVPGQPAPISDVTVEVDEAGLPARGDEPAGSEAATDSETTTGTIIVSSPDSPNPANDVAINGVPITTVGQTIETDYGIITIIAIRPGEIDYNYTLTDNTGEPVQDVITVTITDPDGDTATGTITVNITDDTPTARDDTVTLAAGDDDASGNVITGEGSDDVAASADTLGADGFGEWGIYDGDTPIVAGPEGLVLVGQYGTLTAGPNGEWTYVRTVEGDGTYTETFTYFVRDGDGSQSEATLTIVSTETSPTLTLPQPGNPAAGTQVDEAGLPARAGESAGSDAAADSETTAGTITFTDGDTPSEVRIDGTLVTNVGQTFASSDGLGVLTITSIASGSIGYSFTLLDNTSGDATSVSYNVSITDADGGAGANDTVSGQLVIDIVDDVPTARDDSATGTENQPVTVAVLGNDTPGADSLDPANGVEYVEGSLTGTGTVSYDGAGNFTYTPGAAEAGSVSFQYRITDGDGDSSVATVIITYPADSVPTVSIAGDDSVDEAGLDGPPAGSDAASDSEIATGTIAVDGGTDGIASLVIGGVDVTNGGTVTGTYGTLTVTGNPSTGYTYTYVLDGPTTDGPGAEIDRFAVVVTDGDGTTLSDTLDIEIIDDVPNARDDFGSGAEGAPVSVNVLANDVRGADGVNAATGVELVPGSLTGTGTLAYDGNGTYTYTPGPGEEGTVTFRYEITDGDGDTDIATVTITLGSDSTPQISLSGGNSVDEAGLDGPPAGSAAGSDAEFTSGIIGTATGNDSIGSLVVGGVDVTNGGIVIGAYGTLTVTGNPDAGYSYRYELTGPTTDGPGAEVDSFAVVLTDSDGDVTSDTLSIEIIDDVPTARNDSATGTDVQGTPITIDVIANDTAGADGVNLATGVGYVAGSLSGSGSVAYDGAGNFTYTPGANEVGTVTFQYRITDGDGDTSVATVTITLPNDSEPTVTISGDNSVDEAGLPGGSNAASNSEIASGQITLTSGEDSIVSLVIDGVNVTNGGTVTGDYGTLVVTGNPVAGYSYTYTLAGPITDGAGTEVDSFNVVATDSDGDVTSAPLDITVIDDVPLAEDDSASNGTNAAAPIDVDVIANDTQGADGVNLATGVELVAGTLTGTGELVYNGDGTFTYTPGANETGEVRFDYRITDGDGDQSEAEVVITLRPDTDPEISFGGDNDVDEAGLDGPPAGSDATSDGEVAAGTLSIATGEDTVASLIIGGVDVTNGGTVTGAYGELIVSGNPTDGYTYVYTLSGAITDADGAETDDFAVVVTDSDGDTDGATLSIEIIDDVPTARDDLKNAENADDPVRVNVIANDTPGADGVDLDTGVALVEGSIVGTGSVVYDGDGFFIYTPGPNDEGEVSFRYTITDGDGDMREATVRINLGADSEPVIQSADNVRVDEDGLANANVDDAPLQNDPREVDGSESRTADGQIVVDYGPDVPSVLGDAIRFINADALDGQISSGGVPVDFSIDPATGDLVGTANGAEVIRIEFTTASVDADGIATYDYRVTLSAPVDQVDVGNEENGLGDLRLEIEFEVNDSDVVDTATGSFLVDVLDDVPTANDATIGQPTENDPITVDLADFVVAGADGVDFATVTYNVTQGNAANLSYDDGVFIYTPSAGEEGTIVFDYTITDGDGDEATGTLTIELQADDVPVIGAIADLTVDEDGLAGANVDGAPQDPTETAGSGSASASSTFSVDFGDDLPATLDGAVRFVEADVASYDGVFTQGGEDIVFALENGQLVGRVNGAGDPVITLSIAYVGVSGSTATYQVVALLEGPVDQADPGSEDLSGLLTVSIEAVDADGSVSAPQTVGVQVLDDVQTLTVTVTDGTGEAQVATTDDAGTPNSDSLSIEALVDYAIVDSIDGRASESADYGLTLLGATPASGLTSGGAAINLFLGADGVVYASTAGDLAGAMADPVFTVAIVGGNVTLTQYDAIDHATGSDLLTLADGLIGLTYDITVVDGDGDVADENGTIDLGGNLAFIDDQPLAVDDDVTNGTNATAPVDVNVIGNDTLGADGVNLATGVELVAGTLTGTGTLVYNGDGSFTYTPGANETGEVRFDYRITDIDGDSSRAEVTITLNDDSAPQISIAGDSDVDEAGLDGPPAGTDAPSDSDIAVGTISVATGEDSLASLVIGGVDVTNGGTVTGAYGQLVVIGNPVDGYTYEYTLSAAITDGAGVESDSFAVVATDNDGSVSSDSLVIEIIDDTPIAVDDTAMVGENGSITNGNVISNDVSGADGGLTVVNASAGNSDGNDGNVDTSVAATYPIVITTALGTLSLNADGSYSYDPSVSLADGEVREDVFTYTVRDADGDLDEAVLTITITGDNVAPTGAAQAVTVSEEGLPGGNPDSDPAGDDTNDVTASGSFAFTDGDNDTLIYDFGTARPALQTADGTAVVWQPVATDGTTGVLTLVGTAGAGGDPVITVTLDPSSGAYTVTLGEPLRHPDGSVEDELAITIPVTVDDGNVTVDTSLTINVEDDSPEFGTATPGTAPALATDDDTLGTDAEDFADDFAGNVGADGLGSLSYVLTFTGTGTGLVDVATGNAVLLRAGANGSIEGYVDLPGGGTATVFTLSLSGSTVTLDQDRAIRQNDTTSDNESIGLTGDAVVTLTATLIDADGDRASEPLDITGAISFADSGPSVEFADANDADDGDDSVVIVSSDATLGDTDSANFSGAFSALTEDAGADGQASRSDSYALVVESSASGLTSGGVPILLSAGANGSVVGTANGSLVFTITVDGSGTVSVVQSAAIDHGGDGTSVALADGALDLVRTVSITDRDGDTASDSDSIDLGGNIAFTDDVPTVNAGAADAALQLDETNLTGGSISVSTNYADNFGTAPLDFGNDGPAASGAVSYSLDLTASGSGPVNSGLFALADGATTAGDPIYLVEEGGVVYGTTDPGARTSANTYFSISVDAAGQLTFTQTQNVWHEQTGSDNEPVSLELSGGSLSIVQTLTDADGDSVSGSIDLSTDKFTILDDGPDIAGSPDYTTSNDPTTADFNGSIGLDPSTDEGQTISVNIDLTGLKSGGSTLTREAGTPDNVFVAERADGTDVFTVTVNADGTYSFDLHQPLDGSFVRTNIGSGIQDATSPLNLYTISTTAGSPVAVVTAYSAAVNAQNQFTTFNSTAFANGSGPLAAGATQVDVNGSTQGWGAGGNNEAEASTNGSGPYYNEILVFDFGTLEYGGPAGTNLTPVSSATFRLKNYDGPDGNQQDSVQAVVRYSDGTTSGIIDVPLIEDISENVSTFRVIAPDGKLIESIEFLVREGSGKIELFTVGGSSENVDADIPVTVVVTDGDGDSETTDFNISVQKAATGPSQDSATASAPSLLAANDDFVMAEMQMSHSLAMGSAVALGLGLVGARAVSFDVMPHGEGDGVVMGDFVMSAGLDFATTAPAVDAAPGSELVMSSGAGEALANGHIVGGDATPVAQFAAETAPMAEPLALSADTAGAEAMTATPDFGSGDILMPGAEALAMMAAANRAGVDLEAIGADALVGDPQGSLVEAVLESVAPGEGGMEAIALLQPAHDAVPIWDSGLVGGFTADLSSHMGAEAMMLGPDASSPMING